MQVIPLKPMTNYNINNLKELSHGDDHFFKDMIQLFIKITLEDLEKMKESFKNKNFEGVANAAHKMAGPCSHLEITPLTSVLHEIEQRIRNGGETDTVEPFIEQAEEHINYVINEFQKLIA